MRNISKTTYKAATVLGGWLGVHRFMRGQILFGVLYLLTFGFYGAAWLIDIIIAFSKSRAYQQESYYFDKSGAWTTEPVQVVIQQQTVTNSSGDTITAITGLAKDLIDRSMPKPEKIEQVTAECKNCHASLSGEKGKIAQCSYCQTEQVL